MSTPLPLTVRQVMRSLCRLGLDKRVTYAGRGGYREIALPDRVVFLVPRFQGGDLGYVVTQLDGGVQRLVWFSAASVFELEVALVFQTWRPLAGAS